jgi:hypothetical protein
MARNNFYLLFLLNARLREKTLKRVQGRLMPRIWNVIRVTELD